MPTEQPTEDLASALTEEHHAIDRDVEAFIDQLNQGTFDLDSLAVAIRSLRRHIYLEETFLFPPIQQAGLVMPIQVMLYEHGQLWRTMDTLDELGAHPQQPGAHDQLLTTCHDFLAQLDRHNTKEEPVIYPRAESDLAADASSELAEFLRHGTTPEGWICRRAAE